MKEKFKYALAKFESAFNKLKEAVLQTEDELDKDGVIQRFEFTFEMLWKTLKIFLKVEGIQCQTPKSCLKEAFRINIIKDEDVFLDMLEDRNTTSHIYDKETSETIFNRIKNIYLPNLEKLIANLKKR